jgi:L-galactose dehydrogenase
MKTHSPTSIAATGTDFPLEYRQLGDTSLQVSVLSFGASPLGDVFSRTEPEEITSAVRYAVERGINFFDVSPYYGLTLAEARLGNALHGYRQEIVLATKCGRYGADEFDFSAARITAEFENSLRRLRTDYVDLLQAHDVEFGDIDQIVEETIPAMRRLQQQGKARYIGITGYSLKNLVEIARRANVDSILTYCHCNLMVSDIDDVLVPFAQKYGIGIINASPLHMGILTRSGAPDWHPASPEVREAGRRVIELCHTHGVDASELAIKYSLAHAGVATTLVGMASRRQVEDNLRATQFRIDPLLMAEIQEIVKPVFNTLWPSGRNTREPLPESAHIVR